MGAGRQFEMPDVGEGLTEAVIVSWHVAVGDTVAVNDIIVEVETAKSIVDLPCPFAGVVSAIHFAPGQTVAVGTGIIDVVDPSEAPPGSEVGAPKEASIAADVAEPARRRDVLVGYGPTPATVARRPRKQQPPPRLGVLGALSARQQIPYATPPVRKLARQLGVDLRSVTPSGPGGRVVRADLQVGGRRTGEALRITPDPDETRTPVTGVRKATAAAMVASAFTAPHVTEWVSVDMTRTLKLVKRLRADGAFAEVRISPLVLVARAVLVSLARHPAVNAKWDSVSGEIIQYRDVNLGIATATPRGLLVPNVRAAQGLSTRELAGALSAMIAEAREGRTPPDRMKGGTFTITNIGVFGVDGGTPILNPGEAAILCLGQIRRQPWEHKGKIKLRDVATLALSFDHRVIDGDLGSRLLAEVARVLTHPALAL